MSDRETINLARTQEGYSQKFFLLESRLIRASYIGLISILILGVVVGSMFLVLQQMKRNLETSKLQLIDKLNSQRQKEATFLAIKDRTTIVDKAIASQRSWAPVLDSISAIGKPPLLSSVSVGDKLTVQAGYRVGSVEEMKFMIDTFLAQVKSNRLGSPQLESLQFDKDGSGIQFAVSFIPKF